MESMLRSILENIFIAFLGVYCQAGWECGIKCNEECIGECTWECA